MKNEKWNYWIPAVLKIKYLPFWSRSYFNRLVTGFYSSPTKFETMCGSGTWKYLLEYWNFIEMEENCWILKSWESRWLKYSLKVFHSIHSARLDFYLPKRQQFKLPKSQQFQQQARTTNGNSLGLQAIFHRSFRLYGIQFLLTLALNNIKFIRYFSLDGYACFNYLRPRWRAEFFFALQTEYKVNTWQVWAYKHGKINSGSIMAVQCTSNHSI